MEKIESVALNELVRLLSKTGQTAERKAIMLSGRNIDDSKLIEFISEEEQEELKRILLKLNTEWKLAHAKAHKK